MALWLAKQSPPLHGTVSISTSKNSALPIMAATLLLEGQTCLIDLPALSDIVVMKKILQAIGVGIKSYGNYTQLIANNITCTSPPDDLIQSMRASFLCMGPLLARCGEATISPPGGCKIGKRPVDLHLKGFERLGVTIEIKDDGIVAKGELRGANIELDFPSVGATENLIMAAVLAKGKTKIFNAAREPEIVDLCDFLRKAGAIITGDGTKTIRITGVNKLTSISHRPIADRMETGTFMYATAILGGDVIIKNARAKHVDIVSKKLTQAGVHVIPFADSINIKSYGKKRNVNIATAPHPGFPTDLQAPAMVLATVSMGSCTIKEHIFENRMNHANELIRLGAKIKVDKQYASVSGSDMLSGAEVEACDLRAGAALVLAGLAAEGTTIIHDVGHIKRGYDGFGVKLSALGANLSLMPDN